MNLLPQDVRPHGYHPARLPTPAVTKPPSPSPPLVMCPIWLWGIMKVLKSILWRKKTEEKQSSLELPAPTGPIVDAFREYINNEIPARFIDTARLHFVSRSDVFRVFRDEIEQVTEKQIDERIRIFHDDPLLTYQPRRESILRQIIQETVKYNVLSHRWGNEADEPTYHDISDRKQNVAKFTKLVNFCETAGRTGCKLAWVDTCCIDRTNGAELTEAIHGMYKWYANSFLCIAYLGESTATENWDKDSWFSRGWTLQELLAPRRLRFYDKDWLPLVPYKPSVEDLDDSNDYDDRKDAEVNTRIEKVTGISKIILTKNNSLGVDGHSFWEIMTWASKRKTTRIEDRAYCLVGLFGVSLPIAYGEGERAFSRLLEALMAKNPSWDIFAWCGQPSKHHFALPPSPESYGKFEADLGDDDRVGVQEFRLTAVDLSLKSLPPIPMQFHSFEVREGKVHVILKMCNDKSSLGSFDDLVVECGSTRLKTMGAKQLSVCIINHHGKLRAGQGKLVKGKEYICFLLYKNADGGDGDIWMKLTTDNLLRISYLGLPDTPADSVLLPEAHSDDRQVKPVRSDANFFPLVETIIKQPPVSRPSF